MGALARLTECLCVSVHSLLLCLTGFVDQHLPQLFLVAGMYEVKDTLSSQVKLQQRKSCYHQHVHTAVYGGHCVAISVMIQ